MKKPLKIQLEEALKEVEYQKGCKNEYRELKLKAEEDLNKLRNESIVQLSRSTNAAHESNRTLLEIIRWMVYPPNSKDPWNEMERHKNSQRPQNF